MWDGPWPATVEDEHALQRKEAGDATDTPALERDRDRLRSVNVELDRCWDLLRQRRARRTAGGDPDDARVRDADILEHYGVRGVDGQHAVMLPLVREAPPVWTLVASRAGVLVSPPRGNVPGWSRGDCQPADGRERWAQG